MGHHWKSDNWSGALETIIYLKTYINRLRQREIRIDLTDLLQLKNFCGQKGLISVSKR